MTRVYLNNCKMETNRRVIIHVGLNDTVLMKDTDKNKSVEFTVVFT